MQYDRLWELVERVDWRLITPEYIALAIGAFVIAMVLMRSRMRIWKRIETIEIRLSKVQSEIATILQVQAALITKLNANPKVEIDPPDTVVEMAGGEIVGQPTPPQSKRTAGAGRAV